MAIIKDKARKQYYITYKYKGEDGEWHTANIRNKAWKFGEVGMRYMQDIEREEIEKAKAKRQSQSFRISEEMTLGELCQAFCGCCRSEGMDYETVYNYELSFKNYLFPVIPEATSVSKAFELRSIDRYRANLTSKGLKSKTCNNKMIAVKNLLKYAKKRKYVSRDMADDAIDALAPFKEGSRISEHENFFVNGEEDVRNFIESFNEEDSEWKVPILTLFYGALRIGEWQALTYESINAQNCTILINKQIDNHGKRKDHTKTGADRYVTLPESFMAELLDYIRVKCIGPGDYLFMGYNGAHVSRHKIRDLVDKHLRLAGLEHITLHGLRHSFATRMFDHGYDVKEVQLHLGHSSMETTMKYYIHYTKGKKRKSLDDLV